MIRGGNLFNKPSSSLCGKALHISPQQVDSWIEQNQYTKPELAQQFKKHLANKPTVQWIGDWVSDPKRRARDLVEHAKANNALFQIAVYNIPNRDAGGFSSGGSGSKDFYLRWIDQVGAGIGSAEGIIIIEPDAVPHAEELSSHQKDQRLALVREATSRLRRKCKNAHIYIDAGHPRWLSVPVITELLIKAGIRYANGISLNVSNSQHTEECFEYGVKIVENISMDHGIIIDTSRNGAGPPPPEVTGPDAWANPPTNRIGTAPTLRVKPPNIFTSRLHGLLWVKTPGESDGAHAGAPRAGEFWPEGAARLLGM
eukprot:GFKZ01004933.1.p1 GENE.GFKZ01004933.1~~GFKZ01004933.1.p1  ORF type:complete len:313 (+),score=36.31 GFKZ01004933.1:425-1363(+)